MQVTSIGGSTYFMTFIDDFSHRTWVYFLKNKYEAFDKFVEFKAQAEKECGHYIKVLISDRGGEYTSNSFCKFLQEIWHKERAHSQLYTTAEWSG